MTFHSHIPCLYPHIVLNATFMQPALTGGCMSWHRNHLLYKLFCASIRHYSPKLVQTDYWIQTGQPTRLPAADRHHRSSTSARFSGGRPHCVVPGQGGCDWTEVSLSAVRGHGDSTLLMIDWESGVYRSCLKMYCTSMDRTMSCRQSSRTPHVAFVPHDRTANVTDWLDMKLSMYDGRLTPVLLFRPVWIIFSFVDYHISGLPLKRWTGYTPFSPSIPGFQKIPLYYLKAEK